MLNKRLLVLMVMLLLISLTPTGAETGKVAWSGEYILSFLGQAGGISHTVAYDGTYAYLNRGPHVLIWTSPTRPTPIRWPTTTRPEMPDTPSSRATWLWSPTAQAAC